MTKRIIRLLTLVVALISTMGCNKPTSISDNNITNIVNNNTLELQKTEVNKNIAYAKPSNMIFNYGQYASSFARCESFENNRIPPEWSIQGGVSLELSKKHFKHGISSLLWNWKKGSKLWISNHSYLKEAGKDKNGGIKAWVYNEKAIDDKLTINLGSKEDINQNNPLYTFTFGLNFTGWRAFWVHFQDDASNRNYKGKRHLDLDIMEIVAPTEAESGSVYFDIIEFVNKMQWNRTPDYQMPKSRTEFNEGKGGTWDRTLYYSLMTPRIPLQKSVSPEEKKAFKVIEERLEKWIYGDALDLTQEPLKIRHDALQRYIGEGLAAYEALQIKRDEDNNLTGLPLFASRSTHGPKFGEDIAENIFIPLVYDYKINGNESSKQKVLDLFDHFYDQGWAEGSAIGTLDHETNRSAGYFYAAYLMKDELKKTGRLDRELATINWYVNFGKTFGKFGVDYTETTADELRTLFMYKLLYVLSMDDSPQKAQYMKGLVDWYNSALAIAPGFACTIKPDYTGFHHRGIYGNAYTPGAYQVSSIITYLLHDTVFSLSEESVQNLKNALKTNSIISNLYDVPIGISGRFPRNNSNADKIPPAFAYLALASEPIDTEMAGYFMRLWKPESRYMKQELFPRSRVDLEYFDTIGGLQMMTELAKKGYIAEKDPEGFWMKPYGALAIHRRNNWMISTKGWSQYVWDFEAGKKDENIYGRYISYGMIQILVGGNPINTVESGYDLDNGWDWNRMPGTTTKYLLLEKLAFDGKHRYFTDETFVGGVSSDGSNGIFAMKLHDTVYDRTFRANKSVFYFDNEIICLGSDIESQDKSYATETTLFQSSMLVNSMPFWINSEKAVTQLPYSMEIANQEAVWLIDPYKNGYFIPNATGLHVERKLQQSMDASNRRKTSGYFTTAWLDHGKSPQNGEYEYAILVQTTPEQVETFAKLPPYKVLQKDKKAHIVEHKKQESIGYVIFDAKLNIPFGIVKKVSNPAIMMVKNKGDEIIFSLADPDLRLPKLPHQRMDEKIVWTGSKMQKVRIELEGSWKMKTSSSEARIINSSASTSIIEFDCIHGKTIEIVLSK